MRIKLVLVLWLFSTCTLLSAQSTASPPYELSGGYSYLSNSFNGTPGSRQPLSGGDGSLGFPAWHRLRFKLDYSMYQGTNLGAPQHAFFILGGGQYEVAFHRERIFVEGLVGEGGLNRNWFTPNGTGYKNGSTGTNASFAEFLGGGADTPVASHVGIRIEGGVLHTNFNPLTPLPSGAPYHLDSLPNYFGRISAGVVWTPRLGSSNPEYTAHIPVESDIVFEGVNSVGHFKIFANSWWSELSSAGVEYDRHSWGRMIGARRDYTAEFLPVIILRQPSKTDVWGNRRSTTQETVPGIGISPIGMRLLWNDEGRVKPYFVVKGGMTFFTKKAFSQDASYENFSLQDSVGLQVRMTDRLDFRTGFEIFHSSNGFVVPSNPGLDEMTYNAGLCYHLGGAGNRQ